MTRTPKTRANKYAATCADCAQSISAGAGRLVQEDGEWLVFCVDTAACAATAEAKRVARDEAALSEQEAAEAEFKRREALGQDPDFFEVLADVQAARRGVIQVAPATRSTRRRCDECGRGARRHDRVDSSGIAGKVCDRCNREPSYALSFA